MRRTTFLVSAVIVLGIAACNLPVRTGEGAATQAPALGSTPAVNTPTSKPTSTPTEIPATQTSNPTPTQTPGPIQHLAAGTALGITHIDMIDSKKGWAIGGAASALSQDHVLWTAAGGSTWKDVTPPENTVVSPATERIAVGAFWDSSSAWVTFYSANLLPPPTTPVVWKTTDGGATWQASAPLDLSGWVGTYQISDLFFINPRSGWILAHKGKDAESDRIALFHTTDAGGHWERVVDPSVESDIQDCEKTGILFTGPWNGWLTGDCHGNRAGVFLYQTFDGGKSWIEAKLPNPSSSIVYIPSEDFACSIRAPIFFAQATNFILSVEYASKTSSKTGAFLFSSSLNGSPWHIMEYPGGLMVVRGAGDGRVFRGDVGSGLAIGQNLYMYISATNTWEKMEPLGWQGQFDFSDFNEGWAAARNDDTPVLMHTLNGGRAWQALTPVVME